MSAPTPSVMVKPFAVDAGVDFITYPIPAPTQIPITPGAASLTTGFPPLNMQDPESQGGVPMFGQDMNGILRMLSAYCVWLQAGGAFFWDAAFVTENTGYAVGAVLKSASTAGRYWYNTSANNANNPDSVSTGWVSFSVFGSPTGSQSATPGGSFTVALTAGAGFLEVTPSGDSTLTDVTGALDGQMLTISNLSGVFSLTVASNTHFRMTADLTLLENQSASFRWNASLTKWIPVNG